MLAIQNLIRHLGCSIDQLETLNCETLREAGDAWEPSLVSVMGKEYLWPSACA